MGRRIGGWGGSLGEGGGEGFWDGFGDGWCFADAMQMPHDMPPPYSKMMEGGYPILKMNTFDPPTYCIFRITQCGVIRFPTSQLLHFSSCINIVAPICSIRPNVFHGVGIASLRIISVFLNISRRRRKTSLSLLRTRSLVITRGSRQGPASRKTRQ